MYLPPRRPSLTPPIYYKDKVMTIGDNSPYLYLYDSSTGKLDRQAYVGFTAGALFSPDGAGPLFAASGTNMVWAFPGGL